MGYPAGRKHRILVADDNVDLAESMGLLLEMMGNEVRVTNDGTAAVAAEIEFLPDVVFLDLGMQNLNGLRCLPPHARQSARTRTDHRRPYGLGTAGRQASSREAGFDHHLVKPIEPAALEQFLRQLDSSRVDERQAL